MSSAAQDTLAVVKAFEAELAGSAWETRMAEIRVRLEGPLRLAIAGRMKAGKSTLLNALVGERLAPTDAGECTKLVSHYRYGQRYEVHAQLHDGGVEPVMFRRDGGSLTVELGGRDLDTVRSLDVSWPSSTLSRLTLIDTPGLASLNEAASRRTIDLLSADADGGQEGDAVVYLMRHLHRTDVDFLDAFMDRGVTGTSPVNALALLARADEIGAGRVDALDSAARIATRYQGDPMLSSLVSGVLPIAGLLAETGLTLREEEAAALRTLATSPDEELEEMLLSTDHFVEVDRSALTAELRIELLGRLGLYGVRFAVGVVRGGQTSATALGAALVERSGLGALRDHLTEHFQPRAQVLKARSAIGALRTLSYELRVPQPDIAARLGREVERLNATAIDLAKLRAAHLVSTGQAKVPAEERAGVNRLMLVDDTRRALGVETDAPDEVVARVALDAIEHWRARAGDYLASPNSAEVFETAARVAELAYVVAARPAP